MTLRVYIETTIPSYLTAHPSRQLVRAAQQHQTADWWDRRAEYEMFVSELVLSECRAGDPLAAAARLAVLSGIPLLDQGEEVAALAAELLRSVPLPDRALADAVHIATAAVHGMDLLLTWNCRHIANPVLRPQVEEVCRSAGYEPPAICTPGELLFEEDSDE